MSINSAVSKYKTRKTACCLFNSDLVVNLIAILCCHNSQKRRLFYQTIQNKAAAARYLNILEALESTRVLSRGHITFSKSALFRSIR